MWLKKSKADFDFRERNNGKYVEWDNLYKNFLEWWQNILGTKSNPDLTNYDTHMLLLAYKAGVMRVMSHIQNNDQVWVDEKVKK